MLSAEYTTLPAQFDARKSSIRHLALSIVPFFSERRQVFAHRGGCHLGPENTIAAFDIGMSTGADGLELDVHLSADNVVVVHHDKTLDRTTNVSGPVAALTAAELARVDAGYWFRTGDQYPFRGRGVGVPTLEDVLQRYRGVPTIIEIKVYTAAMGEAVAAVVRRTGTAASVCIAGYGPASARAARAALPGVAASAHKGEVRLALYRCWLRCPVRTAPYHTYQVPERAEAVRIVSPRFVRDAHSCGFKVQVWTVDEEADMRRLLEWGVDGLISNRPDLAVRVRDEFLARAAAKSPTNVSPRRHNPA
jgi:glycerophosphoryl diester phosphodiesterase